MGGIIVPLKKKENKWNFHFSFYRIKTNFISLLQRATVKNKFSCLLRRWPIHLGHSCSLALPPVSSSVHPHDPQRSRLRLRGSSSSRFSLKKAERQWSPAEAPDSLGSMDTEGHPEHVLKSSDSQSGTEGSIPHSQGLSQLPRCPPSQPGRGVSWYPRGSSTG